MSRLAIYVIGPPHIELNGTQVKFNTRKTTALLAYLSMNTENQHRDALVNLLWPDKGPSQGRANLRNSLSDLRKELPAGLITADRETICLNSRYDIWVDINRFHQLISQCDEHGHGQSEICTRCLAPLSEAVDLLRGEFLAGFSLKDSINFDEWQRAQSQSLIGDTDEAFARLVQCLRQEGLTQKAIQAAQKWLELDNTNEIAHRQLMVLYANSGRRSAALHQYRECEAILEREFGVSPEEDTVRLKKEIEAGPVAAASQTESLAPGRPLHTLPRQLTSFIGRETEVREIGEILKENALLTLTGPGGSGKTRLAIEAAKNLLEYFGDGVRFVSLASLSDSRLLAHTLAGDLDLRTHSMQSVIQTLSLFLDSKHMLIILDNCEHLVDECGALVGALLDSCEHLRILVTSREPLHIRGEREFNVEPLEVPPDILLSDVLEKSTGRQPARQFQRFDSIKLYLERARTVLPHFRLTEDNALAIAHICIHLDGLPLAIELAAARVKTHHPDQIAKHIDQGFGFLKGTGHDMPVRQRTLRNEVEWSYDLLNEREKKLFAKLSVFVGGFSQTGAVCVSGDIGPGTTVSEDLDSLVDKSLVQCRHVEGEARFEMLEIVREFARERLVASGEIDSIQARHAAFFLSFAEQIENELRGPSQIAKIKQLGRENGNLQAALSYFERTGRLSDGLRMTAALGFFWLRRGLFQSGKQWLGVFLPRSAPPTREEAAALYWASWIYLDLGMSKEALEFTQSSFETYRAIDDKQGTALALAWYAALERFRERWKIGWDLGQKSVKLALEADDPWTTAQALYFTYTKPKPPRIRGFNGKKVRAMFDDSISRLREAGDSWGLATGLHGLGDTLTEYFEDFEEACVNYQESLAIFESIDDRWMAANTLRCLGEAEILRDNFEGAGKSLRQAVEYFDELGSYTILPVILDLSVQLALRRNDSRNAARCLGAAGAIARSLRGAKAIEQRVPYKRLEEVDLSNEDIAADYRNGLSMSFRQAIEFAKGLKMS